MKRKVLLVLAAIFLMFTVTANASTISDLQVGDSVMAEFGDNWVNPFVGGITLVSNGATYGYNIGSDAVWAGSYRFDVYDSTGTTLLADEYASFCMDITADPAFSLLPHELSAADANLEWMWGTYYDEAITSASTAAAFQLAVWELVHETAGSPTDLASGSFFLGALNPDSSNNNGATFDGLIATANTYLDSTTWTTQANLVIADASNATDSYQPFAIEVSPVPEPATMTLLVLGLLGIAAIVRKRNA